MAAEFMALTSTLVGTGFQLEDLAVSTENDFSDTTGRSEVSNAESEEAAGDTASEDSTKQSNSPSEDQLYSLTRKSSGYAENMVLAMEAVRDKKMSIRRAAKSFKVPKSTLQNRLKNVHTKTVGGQRKFSAAQETILLDILEQCLKLGFPLDRKDLVKILTSLGESKGIPVKKFSGRWYRVFLDRSKDTSGRLIQQRHSRLDKKWNNPKCDRWITALGSLKTDGYLDDPSGVWAFSQFDLIMSELYRQNGVRFAAEEGNPDLLTVSVCGNAAGRVVSPFFSYDGENDRVYDAVNLARLFWIHTVQSGIREDEILAEYFKQEILPPMTSEKNVIFMDEQLYAGNPLFIQALFDSGKDIRVMCYPYCQSKRLQPLSRSRVKDIHTVWREQIIHLRQAENEVTQAQFPDHLQAIWSQIKLPETITSGIASTGLFPMNADMVRSTIPGPLDPNRPIKRSRKQRREETIIRESMGRLGLEKKAIRSVLSAIRKIIRMDASGEVLLQSPARTLVEKFVPPTPMRSHHKKSVPAAPVAPTDALMDEAAEVDVATFFASSFLIPQVGL